MRRSVVRLTLFTFALIAIAVGLPSYQATAETYIYPTTQSGNLLVNPSFEQPFLPDLNDDGGGFIAHGWTAWFFNDDGDEFDGPEFKQANIEIDPYRVRSGLDAQQYFRAWAKHLAGVYQTVDVPANSRLQFSIYGHAWSGFCDTEKKKDIKCDARDSNYGAGLNPMAMKVGIDPTGGTSPYSDAIIWSPVGSAYDNYELFSVEGTAIGGTVTVFVYSTPDWPSAVINVYWDDAELIVTAEGEPAEDDEDDDSDTDTGNTDEPSGGTDNAGSSGGVTDSNTTITDDILPVARQSPDADGLQYHTVQSGESLLRIAVTYGVTVEQLLELNGISNPNNIYIGQRLLISSTPLAEEATEEPTEEATEESAEEPTPAATEESAPEVAEVDTSVNQICMSLFDDLNEDGLRQPEEGLLGGGAFNLTGATSSAYQTDGINEPHCFTDLSAGDYVVKVIAPPGYHATGLDELPLTLSSSGDFSLSFGAAVGVVTENQGLEQPEAGASRSGGWILPLIIGIVGVTLVLGGGAAIFFIRRSSNGGESDDEDDEVSPFRALPTQETSLKKEDSDYSDSDNIDGSAE